MANETLKAFLHAALYELKNRIFKANNTNKAAYWDKEIEKVEKEIKKLEENENN